MNCKHAVILNICLILLSIPVSAVAKLSDNAEAAVHNFMTLRMNLAAYEKPEDALAAIGTYHDAHLTDAHTAGMTDEEKLILENFEVLEKYNYIRLISGMEQQNKDMIRAQYKKNTTWLAAHKDEAVNKWLYCTAADMLSCNLSYASVSTIMHDGPEVKTYYEHAVSQDPDMSYALTNIAQWYYYAPGIGGGSKGKAKNFFEHAVKTARTPSEMYFAKIFLSQYLFEDKTQQARSASLLDDADTLQPGGHYVQWLRRINKAGFSLFYYSVHKLGPEDVDKALGKI